IVDELLAAEARVPAVLQGARDAIAEAVSRVEHALASGGRLVYMGAGTPGRLAAQDAAECPPTFGIAPDRVIAILAGGDGAAGGAVEGADGDAAAATRDLGAANVGGSDVVGGITASGRTPYVLAGREAAKSVGAGTVAIVNNVGSPAGKHADVVIELPT